MSLKNERAATRKGQQHTRDTYTPPITPTRGSSNNRPPTIRPSSPVHSRKQQALNPKTFLTSTSGSGGGGLSGNTNSLVYETRGDANANAKRNQKPKPKTRSKPNYYIQKIPGISACHTEYVRWAPAVKYTNTRSKCRTYII